MRVVVTGVAGLLGSWWAEALLQAGDEVLGIDNLHGGYSLFIPNIEWRRSDCGNLPQMKATLKAFRPEVVVHCAALPYEGLSAFSPSLIFNNVAGASVSLFSAAIQAGVRRIVFTSSMARYGDQGMQAGYSTDHEDVAFECPGFHEEMQPRPVDPYGIAKVAAEETLVALSRVHGTEYLIIVPHNIYGPRQRYWDPYRNVVGIFLNSMLQDVSPPIYGDGKQIRCFSYVEDFVPLLVDFVHRDITNDVFNIGPDKELTTITELWYLCAKITGFHGAPSFVPAPPLEVRQASCLNGKVRLAYGWEPKTSLREGVQKYAAWIQRQGPRAFDYHLPLELPGRAPAHWTTKSELPTVTVTSSK